MRLIQAGTAVRPKTSGSTPAAEPGELLRDPQRKRDPGVHRAAEGDDGIDALAAQVRRRLVAEHPALGIAGEVDVAAGRSRTRSTASQTATTWSARSRSRPPSSRSGAPKSITHGSAPVPWRTETALDAGETS